MPLVLERQPSCELGVRRRVSHPEGTSRAKAENRRLRFIPIPRICRSARASWFVSSNPSPPRISQRSATLATGTDGWRVNGAGGVGGRGPFLYLAE